MPIYEFYCSDCHTVFSFLSRTARTRKRPACPRCGRSRLERRASAFAISKGHDETANPADGPPDGFDDERMERVMAEMAGEVERIDEDNPRQMAGLMRRLFDGAGLPVGAAMEEAMRRMEAGEDPDRIEEDMGAQLEVEEGDLPAGERPQGGRLERIRRRLLAPSVDPTLYEM